MIKSMIEHGITTLIILSLAACAGTVERLSRVGQEPEMTQIRNPQLSPDYREISLPMPEKLPERLNTNSLWADQRASFYKNSRPSEVGDILTVLVDIDDEAEMENSTERTRTSSEDFDMNALLGLQSQLTDVLPESEVDGTDLINMNGLSGFTGDGSIEREEEVELKLAALVIQVLPNKNMVIHGRQEVRVNHEVRELQIAGVVRPEDINTHNEIDLEKIAEARISYGGRGTVSDVQAPRYGSQVMDILMPF